MQCNKNHQLKRGETPSNGDRPFFELRHLRQFAGESGLTQAELATLAAISPRRLRSYECCRAMPESVLAMLSLAIALRVPFEWLIEPRALEELKATVEARRAILAARARRRAEPPAPHGAP